MIVDLYIVYSIIKKLTTPFTKWKAFSTGVIDKDGNILMSKRERKKDRKIDKSFTNLDLMVLRLKSIIDLNPRFKSKFASVTAAMWLIKENYDIPPEMITEENLLAEMDNMQTLMENEAPTNSVANVAGADGSEPGMSRKDHKLLRRIRRKKDEEDT